MSLLDDPKYKFIKEGRFTTEVIFFKTAEGKTRKRIQFREITPERKIVQAKKEKKKSQKKKDNFIPLF